MQTPQHTRAMARHDGLSATDAFPQGAAVAIGNFDGVHHGHRELLRVAANAARARQSAWGVVTFEPHPRDLFAPHDPVFRITPGPVKDLIVESLGADFAVTLAFDHALAALEPDEFVERILVRQLAVSHVVMGYDFHFGRGRKGSPHTMQQLGDRHGFSVTVVDQVTDDAGLAPYSSSGIRQALRHGHISEAADQLGNWWLLVGEVVMGDQRGRTIGFPTANIILAPGCEPAEGIYALRVRPGDGAGGPVWHAAGYIGKRPTFETDRLFLEIHILDFDGDLYGQTLAVEFVDFIRPDRKFGSVGELTAQMTADCAEIASRLQDAENRAPLMSVLDRAAGADAR